MLSPRRLPGISFSRGVCFQHSSAKKRRIGPRQSAFLQPHFLERVTRKGDTHGFEGQFLQTDPVGYEDDLNLYAYVRNDPLNNGDRSGMLTVQIGVELKSGLREQPAASGAFEPGVAIGTRSDGDGW